MRELADLILQVSGVVMAALGLRTTEGKVSRMTWKVILVVSAISTIKYYFENFV